MLCTPRLDAFSGATVLGHSERLARPGDTGTEAEEGLVRELQGTQVDLSRSSQSGCPLAHQGEWPGEPVRLGPAGALVVGLGQVQQ